MVYQTALRTSLIVFIIMAVLLFLQIFGHMQIQDLVDVLFHASKPLEPRPQLRNKTMPLFLDAIEEMGKQQLTTFPAIV
jgi:hypothetical protein